MDKNNKTDIKPKLFSEFKRINVKLPLHNFSEYIYLNESARSEAEIIRCTLENWFRKYPASHANDLAGRFSSRLNEMHTSAAFELYLHELFTKLEYKVTVHPETITNKNTKPDFLLEDKDGKRIYIEAVQVTDISDEERAAKARLNVVYDVINKMEIQGWYLMVECEKYPDTQPSVKGLRDELKKWLESLDPDDDVYFSNINKIKELPEYIHQDKDWEISFCAIPCKPEYRNKKIDRVLGGISNGVKWLNTWEHLRDKLLYKGSHYGQLDAPLIIAVNANVFHIDVIDIMEALFGKEQFIFDTQNPEKEPRFGRAPNGLWNGPEGIRYKRVSGVIMGSKINPWNYGVSDLILYQNPWSKHKIKGKALKISRRELYLRKMKSIPGSHPKEILELPPDYPGVQ